MDVTAPRHALITGATGYIGTRLCHQLLQADWRVTAISRDSSSNFEHPSLRWLTADLRCIGDGQLSTPLLSALRESQVVFHLGALAHQLRSQATASDYQRINADATGHLAHAASREGTSRFVFVSSIKTLGERTRNHPFVPTSPPMPLDAYARSKLDGEQQLKQACTQGKMAYTIIRAPLVYGPRVKANLDSLLNAVSRRWPLPLAGVHNARAMIGLTNLVNLLMLVADEPLTKNTILLPADSHLSSPELIQVIAKAMHVRPRLVYLPDSVLTALAKFPGIGTRISRLTQSLTVQDDFLAKVVQYEPQFPIDDEIHQMVQSWQR